MKKIYVGLKNAEYDLYFTNKNNKYDELVQMEVEEDEYDKLIGKTFKALDCSKFRLFLDYNKNIANLKGVKEVQINEEEDIRKQIENAEKENAGYRVYKYNNKTLTLIKLENEKRIHFIDEDSSLQFCNHFNNKFLVDNINILQALNFLYGEQQRHLINEILRMIEEQEINAQ